MGCMAMMFYGVSGTFSTKNEAQYEAIGAFWDEMSRKYGRENLRGLGYGWTSDSIEYAIGLKDGFIDEDYIGIRLPDKNWITVKGRTEELGKLYEKIYEEGSLTFEIETFTDDGECEISYYRIRDDWMEGGIEVWNLEFDTARCTASFQPRNPGSVYLLSSFTRIGASTIKWMDEASHGMCTHQCSPEEIAALPELLKAADVSQWHYIGLLADVAVTEDVKAKILELFRVYLESKTE